METEYYIFGLFLLLSFWIVSRLAFIKNTGLRKWEISLLLLYKICIGIIFAVFFKHFSSTLDYIGYNKEGLTQYHLLLNNPRLFFTDFTTDINTYGLGGLFASGNSFWAYLRFNLLFKMIAFFNLVSRGNFYLNTIIFSTFTFLGHIAFYRIFSNLYPGNKRRLLAVIFGIPSLLLYTACVHKDGIIFVSIALISYVVFRLLQQPRILRLVHWVVFMGGILCIFLFRNYVLAALAPAMILALACKYLHFNKKLVLLLTYTGFILVFFLSGLSQSSFNLPAAVVQRKADFALLETGSTTIEMQPLAPTFTGFLKNLPQAINHTLFRPYPLEYRQPTILLAALELLLYQLMVVLFLFFRKQPTGSPYPFTIFSLALFAHMMLIIGYTIPNIGAIVRYRSIFWVLLLCPLVGNIDWNRIRGLALSKKEKSTRE